MLKNKKILLLFLFIGFFFILTNKSFAYEPFTTNVSILDTAIESHSSEYSYYTVSKVRNSYFIYLSNHPFEMLNDTIVNSSPVYELEYQDGSNQVLYYALEINTEDNLYHCGGWFETANHNIAYNENDSHYTGSGDNFFHPRGRRIGSGSDSSGDNSNDSNESSGILNSISNWFSNLINRITQGFTNVIQSITQILTNLTNILSYLNPFSENFILSGVLTHLLNLLSYLNPLSDSFLGYKLANLIKNVLQEIFIPDTETVETLINNVKSKFAFVDTIKTQISSLKNYFENISSSSSYSFNISNSYGQNTFSLDFSWFSPFKAYTDGIITGFVYLHFIWNIFSKLSGIIQGNSNVKGSEGQ